MASSVQAVLCEDRILDVDTEIGARGKLLAAETSYPPESLDAVGLVVFPFRSSGAGAGGSFEVAFEVECGRAYCATETLCDACCGSNRVDGMVGFTFGCEFGLTLSLIFDVLHEPVVGIKICAAKTRWKSFEILIETVGTRRFVCPVGLGCGVRDV